MKKLPSNLYLHLAFSLFFTFWQSIPDTVDRISSAHDFISSRDERKKSCFFSTIDRFLRGKDSNGTALFHPPPLPQQGLTRRYLCLAALDPAFDDSRSGVNPPPSPGHHWLAALTPNSPPLSPTAAEGEKAREEKSKPTQRSLSISILLRWSIEREENVRFVSFAWFNERERERERGINLERKRIDAFPFEKFFSQIFSSSRIERNSRGSVAAGSPLYIGREWCSCTDEGTVKKFTRRFMAELSPLINPSNPWSFSEKGAGFSLRFEVCSFSTREQRKNVFVDFAART